MPCLYYENLNAWFKYVITTLREHIHVVVHSPPISEEHKSQLRIQLANVSKTYMIFKKSPSQWHRIIDIISFVNKTYSGYLFTRMDIIPKMNIFACVKSCCVGSILGFSA